VAKKPCKRCPKNKCKSCPTLKPKEQGTITCLGKSYKSKDGKVVKVLDQHIQNADAALLKFDDGTQGLYLIFKNNKSNWDLVSVSINGVHTQVLEETMS
jgi:hypothetical protein